MVQGPHDGPHSRDDLTGTPDGDVYDWYRRGIELLGNGSPAAAIQILEHAVAAEPASRSAREALARAQYNAKHYPEAAANFRLIVEADPAEDYALFGLGLALTRMGDPAGAVEHLALAVAMRPENKHYATALRHARAARERTWK